MLATDTESFFKSFPSVARSVSEQAFIESHMMLLEVTVSALINQVVSTHVHMFAHTRKARDLSY
jgi:hypothetical protein